MRPCPRCRELLAPDATACAACGDFVGSPEDLVDGRFSVVRELGRGAMGRVLLARDVSLGRPVALKLLHPDVHATPAALARLQREAAALGRIRSPYVVQVYSFGTSTSGAYFAMEYVEGPSLASILAAHGEHGEHVPLTRLGTILSRLAEGLADAHRAGLIHRDVKPDNVIVEEETGRPVLVDFGLVDAARRPGETVIHGTPAFIAPEQVLLDPSRPVGPEADQYALACTAFELLTGGPPFVSDDLEELFSLQVNAPPPRASSIRPELVPVDEVLLRALAKDPAKRYPSVVAFARDLEIGLGAVPGGEMPSRRSSPPPDATDRATVVSSTRRPGGSLRVAVLDDDPTFRRMAHRAAQIGLFGADVVVVPYASGEELLKTIDRSPDLLLLDYEMPGPSGLEVLTSLRARRDGGETRVLVVSGRAGMAERWRFSVLGVDTFVAKPVDFTALVSAVHGLAARAGFLPAQTSVSA